MLCPEGMPGLEGILGYQHLRGGAGGLRRTAKAFLLGIGHGEDATGFPLTQASCLLIVENFDYTFLCIPLTLEGGSETGFTYLVLDKENNSTKTKRLSALGINKGQTSTIWVRSPCLVL